MHIIRRISRHVRLSFQAVSHVRIKPPPFLILFINSVCNLKCEHCFYWSNLNKKNDLTFDEIITFAKNYGPFENLNLSGGEPFIHSKLGEICRFFIKNNKVKQIYIPTNAYFPDKIRSNVLEILKEPTLELLVIEISLDGMPEYHNKLRGDLHSFEKAMMSYRILEKIQTLDVRLKIHANTTVTSDNVEEVKRLTKYLYDNCSKIEHHNIALIHGNRKNSSLQIPDMEAYKAIYNYVYELWQPKEKGRFGAIVEPMLQWAKCKTVEAQDQVIPCMAGKLSAVVYANGDVSVCEGLPPLGNLRSKKFTELWCSYEAQKIRQNIRSKKCYCTHEIFMWSSITFQPFQLLRALVGIMTRKRQNSSLL